MYYYIITIKKYKLKYLTLQKIREIGKYIIKL